MAAFAPATPFKGESLPVYVLQRMPARAPAASSSSRQPSTGPLIADVSSGSVEPKHATISAVSSGATHRCVPTDNSSPVVAALPSSQLLSPSSSRRETTVRSITKPSRPSLSDQLKAISSDAEGITSQLRSCYKLGEPAVARASVPTFRRQLSQTSSGWGTADESRSSGWLLETTTTQLSVGRLDCRFPCPVRFAADRCVYLFQHPFEAKEVLMVMYYRDMRHVQLREHDRTLRFRVAKSLEQFGEDYNPSNRQHYLRVVFATVSETERVKRFLAQYRHVFRGGQSDDDENNGVPWDERRR
ncbi:hypothetical protein PINS_up007526 [Pythium insidiosum]|nr:hypothetical protein PINS_up007526 [Pythium insidiosum]